MHDNGYAKNTRQCSMCRYCYSNDVTADEKRAEMMSLLKSMSPKDTKSKTCYMSRDAFLAEKLRNHKTSKALGFEIKGYTWIILSKNVRKLFKGAKESIDYQHMIRDKLPGTAHRLYVGNMVVDVYGHMITQAVAAKRKAIDNALHKARKRHLLKHIQ